MTGFNESRLQRLCEVIEGDIDRGAYFGASVEIWRNSELALRKSFGHQDESQKMPIKQDTVFPLMSISKTFVAMVILAHVERGGFLLTTRIADVIPEFGINGKSEVTVAQLMSHTSGLGNTIVTDSNRNDPQVMLARVCRDMLQARPGHYNYCAETSYFVLGEFLMRIKGGGGSLGDLMSEYLFEPLAMNNTAMTTTAEFKSRRVPITVVGEPDGMFSKEAVAAIDASLADGHVSPGASGIGTVGDVSRFARMLLSGGTLDGAHVLSPAMINFATQIHTGDDILGALEYGRTLVGWPAQLANYGLGLQMRGPAAFQPAFHGTLASPGAFGHKGAGLTCFWADPDTGVSFVCLTTGFLEEMQSIRRWQKLSDMVHAAII